MINRMKNENMTLRRKELMNQSAEIQEAMNALDDEAIKRGPVYDRKREVSEIEIYDQDVRRAELQLKQSRIEVKLCRMNVQLDKLELQKVKAIAASRGWVEPLAPWISALAHIGFGIVAIFIFGMIAALFGASKRKR